MSAGIKSGVNWIRENGKRQHLRQRPHQHRLSQPRHALQQRMPPDINSVIVCPTTSFCPTITFPTSERNTPRLILPPPTPPHPGPSCAVPPPPASTAPLPFSTGLFSAMSVMRMLLYK